MSSDPFLDVVAGDMFAKFRSDMAASKARIEDAGTMLHKPGFGDLLKSTLGPPEHDGPPWTHTLTGTISLSLTEDHPLHADIDEWRARLDDGEPVTITIDQHGYNFPSGSYAIEHIDADGTLHLTLIEARRDDA